MPSNLVAQLCNLLTRGHGTKRAHVETRRADYVSVWPRLLPVIYICIVQYSAHGASLVGHAPALP